MEGEQQYSARDRDENSQWIVETNLLVSTLSHFGRHTPLNDECFGAHCEPWFSARAMTADSRDPCQPIFSTMKDHPPISSRQRRRPDLKPTIPCASASGQAGASLGASAAQASGVGRAYIGSRRKIPALCCLCRQRVPQGCARTSGVGQQQWSCGATVLRRRCRRWRRGNAERSLFSG